MPFSTYKTTNPSYFPLVGLVPAWDLRTSGNPWDSVMDALDALGSGTLADPGANGIIKRTSLNVTAAAVAGTDYLAPGNLSWTAPTLLNSWANNAIGFVVAGYTKNPFGVVSIQGVITGGTTTAGTVIFTLPSGYRPAAAQLFIIPVEAGSSNFCALQIDTTGDVRVFGGWGGITTVALVATFSIF